MTRHGCQLKTLLLSRLSDSVPSCQTMKTMDTGAEFALTSMPCPGMKPKVRTMTCRHTFPHHFRKPMLCLIISLVTSSEPGPPFSTAISQFHNSPQAEWLNLLNGYTVDLDHVFSNIYTTTHATSDVVELRKNIELLHGSLTPAKTVKTHGDWVIAWDCLVDATLFVFKHGKQELQAYSKHVQRYFASLLAL